MDILPISPQKQCAFFLKLKNEKARTAIVGYIRKLLSTKLIARKHQKQFGNRQKLKYYF